MEDKVIEVNLDNLKKEDFMELVKYINFLEGQIQQLNANVEQLKTYCITLKTQRVNADNKVIQMQAQMMSMNNQPISVKLNEDVVLINPEQYREKKQF
jgi:hypothetical protein